MKVAVFGKPGGGKSTLGQKIAVAANLPLYQLDLIQFRKGGARVPDEELARLHADILLQPRWVLDGFGTRQTALRRNVRFAAGQTAALLREASACDLKWKRRIVLRRP